MPFTDTDILGRALGADNKVGYSGSRQNNGFSVNTNKFSPSYVGLAESNPYASPIYRKSWIQKVLESLGFRTNYDTYMESMNIQAKEYENALLQKQYNEQYDDPSARVARERAAGLNPDLTGNISSGEASPMVDDGNPPVVPEADDFGLVMNFAGSCIQGLQGAFAMAGQVMNLKGQSLDNRSKALSQISQEDNMMMDAMLNILPEDSNEPLNYDQLYDSFRRTYGKRIKKKYFADFVSRAFNFQKGLSFSEKKFSKRNLRATERKGFFSTTSGSDYSEVDEVMSSVSKVLSDLALELNTKNIRKDIIKNNNDTYYEQNVRPEEIQNKLEFEQSRNPSQESKNVLTNQGLDIDIKKENRDLLQYKRQLRSSYKKILSKLESLEDNGNWFAPYAKIALSTWLMKFIGD